MTGRQPARRAAPPARAIAEGALLADLTVMVTLAGLYVPYAGAVLAAIAPIPLLLVVLRQGWRVAIEAFVASFLLVTFLSGPFTSFAVLAIALRGFALAIGLRRGWRVGKTVFTAATFLWAIVWIGVTIVALAFPDWRATTEQGLTVTYHQATGLAGIVLTLFGQGHLWHQLSPRLNDFLAWFLSHWLVLLPLFAWPVLLVMSGAEYAIIEVVLPRFGFHPPPMRLPLLGSAGQRKVRKAGRLRRHLEQVLLAKLQQRQTRQLRRSSRRLAPAAAPVDSFAARRAVAAEPVTGENPHRDATITTRIFHHRAGGLPVAPTSQEEVPFD